MTKVFLEPIVLKVENENLVLDAFSKKSYEKLKDFDKNKRVKLKRRTAKRKLLLVDLFCE